MHVKMFVVSRYCASCSNFSVKERFGLDFLGPPCGTWFRALSTTPRTSTDPWKIGSLSTAILHDKRCAQVALQLATRMHIGEIAWVLEHPETRLLRETSEYRALIRLHHAFVVHLHQCQVGSLSPRAFESHPGT